MGLRPLIHPEPIPNHIGIHHGRDRLFTKYEYYYFAIRSHKAATKPYKPLRFVVLKAVCQFPKKNTVEALWRVIQMLPHITWGKTLTAVPVQTEKHVAYV